MLIIAGYFLLTLSLSYYRPIFGLTLAANAYLFAALYDYIGGSNSELISVAAPTLSFTMAFIRSIIQNKKLSYRAHILDYLFIILFAVFLLSSFTSLIPLKSVEYAFRYLALGVSFYYATKVCRTCYPGDIEFSKDLLLGIYASGFLLAIIALYYNASSSIYITRLTIGNSSSIPLSISLGLAVLVGIYFLIGLKASKLLFLNIFALAIITYAFLATNTRSVIIALVVALALMSISNNFQLIRRNLIKFTLFSIFAFIAISYLISMSPEFLHRLITGFSKLADNDLGESESSRLTAWDNAIAIFYDNPIFGIGAGVFEEIHHMYAHNLFLEIAAETGVSGIIIILLIFAICFRKTFKYSSSKTPIIPAIFVFLFSVSQVSLSFWMHKLLFISIASLFLGASKENRNFSKNQPRIKQSVPGGNSLTAPLP